MRRVLVVLTLTVTCAAATSIAAAESIDFLPAYVPGEQEISSLMNLQAYLAQYNDDLTKEPDEKQFTSLADLSRKYNMLQTYVFEAFLQNTANRKVTKWYRNYAMALLPASDDVNRTVSLLDRPPAPITDGQSSNYRLSGGKTAEWICLFGMRELSLFGGRLHALIYGNNSWAKIDVNNDPTVVRYNCGGGTNAMLIVFRQYNVSSDEFVASVVNKDFYHKMYENWSLIKMAKAGVLDRAGADLIYLGQGAKLGYLDIKESTAALYLYSDKYKQGYEIDWMMNFSSSNVFYEKPERLWHQLAETELLSWIE
jgi:hypothetical protein